MTVFAWATTVAYPTPFSARRPVGTWPSSGPSAVYVTVAGGVHRDVCEGTAELASWSAIAPRCSPPRAPGSASLAANDLRENAYCPHNRTLGRAASTAATGANI